MLFDDRLGTVLRTRANAPATRRIQLRQLLDLLGTYSSDVCGPQIDAAYARLGDLGTTIPAAEWAEMLRDPALRMRNPRLVAALAASDPRIAESALHRADLSEEQWLDLIPALPANAREGLLRRSVLPQRVTALLARLGVRSRGLPPVVDTAAATPETTAAPEASAKPAPFVEPKSEQTAEPNPKPEPQPDQVTQPGAEVLDPLAVPGRDDKIGAIVRRIEAYRRAKQVIEHPASGDQARLPLGEDHVFEVSGPVQACDFATDSLGRITWADAGVAPMLVGYLLGEDEALRRTIRLHQPLRTVPINLFGAPAISGAWQLDAAPWFDPLGGRFLGYRGRLRRPAAPASQIEAPRIPDSEADRIRQMLHELRTPVNAIQIGAEIIQQQLYGPTPNEYRALAAGIAGDAARLMSAFDELERLAKLDSGAIELEPGTADLAAIVRATAGQLDAHTKSRGSGYDLKLESELAPLALSALEVERVIWRLLATLAGTSAPGERLKLRLRDKAGAYRLDLDLPASLAKIEGEALFKASATSVPQVIAAGVFGTGFALRLARAEAEGAGGELRRKGDRLRLILPGLTQTQQGHTDAHRDEITGAV